MSKNLCPSSNSLLSGNNQYYWVITSRKGLFFTSPSQTKRPIRFCIPVIALKLSWDHDLVYFLPDYETEKQQELRLEQIIMRSVHCLLFEDSRMS